MLYLGIVLAGGIGALLRFGLGRAAINMGWTALPFGTLIANLLGCFFIGYLSSMLAHRWHAHEHLQVIVLTGFLGGFTTFSAFSLEAVSMFNEAGNFRTLVYLFLKVTLCISMCFLGLLMAKN